jgi:hypothetical protein
LISILFPFPRFIARKNIHPSCRQCSPMYRGSQSCR